MVGSLFLRSYERSERIYAAMQARGFEGEFRHIHSRATATVGVACVGVVVAACVGFALVAHVLAAAP